MLQDYIIVARAFLGGALVAILSMPAFGADHVLSITVSRYKPTLGIPKLDGVQQDRKSIIQIAREIGMEEAGVVQLQDEGATLDGIRKEFAALAQRVTAGDRVLVYYSGHGSTKRVENACQATLVTYDGADYLSSELHQALLRVRDKQPKHLVVLVDSCHSGEIAENFRHKSLAGDGEQTPKMRPRLAGEDTCRDALNVAAKSLTAETTTSPGTKSVRRDDLVAGQWVMLSAARDNEVAWDGPKGGAATVASLACIADRDLRSSVGDGFITAESLSQCVQKRIDGEQRASIRQHVVVHGKALTPLRPEQSSRDSREQPSSAMSTLEALARNGDPSWVILAEPHVGPIRREDVSPPFQWTTHNQIRIGSTDRLQLSVQSSRAGFLYVVYASRDSNRFSLLFPSNGQDTRLDEPGKPQIIPRRWPALGNAGAPERDALLVIVSDQPFPELHRHIHEATGPATAHVSQQLASATVGKPCKFLGAGEDSGCKAASPRKWLGGGEDTTRPTAERRYGAALVLVDEVK